MSTKYVKLNSRQRLINLADNTSFKKPSQSSQYLKNNQKKTIDLSSFDKKLMKADSKLHKLEVVVESTKQVLYAKPTQQYSKSQSSQQLEHLQKYVVRPGDKSSKSEAINDVVIQPQLTPIVQSQTPPKQAQPVQPIVQTNSITIPVPTTPTPTTPSYQQSNSLLMKSLNQIVRLKPQIVQIPAESEMNLYLSEDSKRRKYYSRPQHEKEDIVHWGQRKLLIAEMWFLLKYGDMSKNILYVGAAPGLHIQLLSELFSYHKFYLYDPNDFQVRESARIKIFNKAFNDKEAMGFVDVFKNDYLFISDIRTANYRQMTPLQNEQAVLKDNELQMRWTTILEPKKALLKFRCAYPTEILEPTEFFKGDIFIQPWAPQSSTETRLVPQGNVKILYDNVKYEEQMFYHNDVDRKQTMSWDEKGEEYILKEYIKHYQTNNKQDIGRQIHRLKELITSRLNINNNQ